MEGLADFFNAWPAHACCQSLRQTVGEVLCSKNKQGNRIALDRPAVLREQISQFTHRQDFALRLFIEAFQAPYRQRLVEQGHLAAHLVFDHMVQENIGIRDIGDKVTALVEELFVVRLLPQLLQGTQAGITAIVEGVTGLTRAARYFQWLLQTDGRNGCLDFGKERIVSTARVQGKLVDVIKIDGDDRIAPDQGLVVGRRVKVEIDTTEGHVVGVFIMGHGGLRVQQFRFRLGLVGLLLQPVQRIEAHQRLSPLRAGLCCHQGANRRNAATARG